MITWIVSYPRSGNTLTRNILRHCFDQPCTEAYVPKAPDAQTALQRWRQSPDCHFVKTHCTDVSLPHERAIYIVRDARAAMSSWRHFQHDMHGRDVPLEDFIRACPPWPSWSAHLDWAMGRRRTLLLRYEELAPRPSRETLSRIAAFTGLPVLRGFAVPFSRFQANNPKLFRVGHNGEGIAAVELQCANLFWQTHGAMMQRLGYAPAFSIAAE